MTHIDHYRTIAKSVLKLASDLDPRFPLPSSSTELATKCTNWALILNGKVWPEEAKAAVLHHYAKSSFALMPSDVVDYCQGQPAWSSIEHAREWVMSVAVRIPYSGAIELFSGIEEPRFTVPVEVMGDTTAQRAFLVEQLTEWARPRLNDLAAAIVAKRYVHGEA